jgi:hypothetical protein
MNPDKGLLLPYTLLTSKQAKSFTEKYSDKIIVCVLGFGIYIHHNRELENYSSNGITLQCIQYCNDYANKCTETIFIKNYQGSRTNFIGQGICFVTGDLNRTFHPNCNQRSRYVGDGFYFEKYLLKTKPFIDYEFFNQNTDNTRSHLYPFNCVRNFVKTKSDKRGPYKKSTIILNK